MLIFAQATGALDELHRPRPGLSGCSVPRASALPWARRTPGHLPYVTTSPRPALPCSDGGMELDGVADLQGQTQCVRSRRQPAGVRAVTSSPSSGSAGRLRAGRPPGPLPGQTSGTFPTMSSVRSYGSLYFTDPNYDGRWPWPSCRPRVEPRLPGRFPGAAGRRRPNSCGGEGIPRSPNGLFFSARTKASCTSTTGITSAYESAPYGPGERADRARRDGAQPVPGNGKPGRDGVRRASATWCATRAAGSGSRPPAGELLGIIEPPRWRAAGSWAARTAALAVSVHLASMPLIRTTVGPPRSLTDAGILMGDTFAERCARLETPSGSVSSTGYAANLARGTRDAYGPVRGQTGNVCAPATARGRPRHHGDAHRNGWPQPLPPGPTSWHLVTEPRRLRGDWRTGTPGR